MMNLGSITNIFSQRTCDVELEYIQPTQDTIVTSDSIFQVQFRLRNYGPNTVLPSDSFYLYLVINNFNYTSNGSKYTWAKRNFPSALPQHSFTSTGIISFPIDSISNISSVNTVCYKFSFADSLIKDIDTTNNIDCFIMKYNFTSLDEQTIKKKVAINWSNNIVTVVSKGESLLKYRIISLEGKIIMNGNLSRGVHELNLLEYASGAYVLQIYNSSENYSTKFFKY